MSKQELKRKLVSFESTTKSYSLTELCITERKLLNDVIKGEKRKGRIVSLGSSKCDRKRCDIYESTNPYSDFCNCRKCILDYYGVV